MKNTKYIYTFPGVSLLEERLVYEGGAEGSKNEAPKAPEGQQAEPKAPDTSKPAADQADATQQALNQIRKPAEIVVPITVTGQAPKQPVRHFNLPPTVIVSERKAPTKPADAQMPTAAAKPTEAGQKPKPTGTAEVGTVETRERPAPTLTAAERADIIAAVNNNPTFKNFVPGPGRGFVQVDVNVPDKGKWTVSKTIQGTDMKFKSW